MKCPYITNRERRRVKRKEDGRAYTIRRKKRGPRSRVSTDRTEHVEEGDDKIASTSLRNADSMRDCSIIPSRYAPKKPRRKKLSRTAGCQRTQYLAAKEKRRRTRSAERSDRAGESEEGEEERRINTHSRESVRSTSRSVGRSVERWEEKQRKQKRLDVTHRDETREKIDAYGAGCVSARSLWGRSTLRTEVEEKRRKRDRRWTRNDGKGEIVLAGIREDIRTDIATGAWKA